MMSFHNRESKFDPEAGTQPNPVNGSTRRTILARTEPSSSRSTFYPQDGSFPLPVLVERVSSPLNEEPLAAYQAIQIPKLKKKRKRNHPFGLFLLLPGMAILAIMIYYFLAPVRTNVLLLGIDRATNGTAVSRSDTIILLTVVPLKPKVGLFSIPRDLWVPIPNVGENRINTAHFFAEANKTGSGPDAAIETIQTNFGVQVPYYIRITFDGFAGIIDAMGGITLDLPQPMSGYPIGKINLDGKKALAFVRDRKGTDDFFRMSHGQLMIRGIIGQLLNPLTWPRLPFVLMDFDHAIYTNLPIWQWPRIGLALIRGVFSGINSQTVTREMVTPYVTSQGAQVLLPKWDLIRPAVRTMFGG